MTADELRDRVQAAGGRGTWEYYRADAKALTVTIVVDYAGKTWTVSRMASWPELAQRREGAQSFEIREMAEVREQFARDMKLPAKRSKPASE